MDGNPLIDHNRIADDGTVRLKEPGGFFYISALINSRAFRVFIAIEVKRRS